MYTIVQVIAAVSCYSSAFFILGGWAYIIYMINSRSASAHQAHLIDNYRLLQSYNIFQLRWIVLRRCYSGAAGNYARYAEEATTHTT